MALKKDVTHGFVSLAPIQKKKKNSNQVLTPSHSFLFFVCLGFRRKLFIRLQFTSFRMEKKRKNNGKIGKTHTMKIPSFFHIFGENKNWKRVDFSYSSWLIFYLVENVFEKWKMRAVLDFLEDAGFSRLWQL